MGQYAIGWLHGRWYYGILWVVWGQYAIGWLHGRWYYGILWVVWDSMLQGGYMDAGTMVYYGQYGIVCYRVATWTLVLWYIMGSMGQYAIGWLRWYYGILWVVWGSMLQGGYMDAGTMVYYGQYGIVCYRVATWTLVLWYIMGSMGQYAIGWLHGRWYYGILWVVWGSMLQGGYMDAGTMVYYGQYGVVCYRVATLVLWYIMGSMGQYAIGWLHGRWYYGILWVVWDSMLQGGYMDAGTMVYYGQYGDSMLQGGYMDAGTMVYYGQYGIVCYRVATGRWYYGILWVVWDSMLQGGYMDAGTMVYYGQYGVVCYRVATLVLWYIMGSMGQYAIGWLRWYYGILWVVWGSMLQGGYMDAGTMVYYGQYGVVCYRVATWTLVLWYIMGSMGQYAIGWLHGRWYYGILWVVWGSMLQGGYMDAGTMVYYGQYGVVCYRVATWTLVLWYIMGSMGQYAIGWLRWYYGILWVVWGSMLQGGYMDAGTMVYYGQYGVVCYRVATWTLVLWYIMGSMGQYAIGWLRWYYGILWVVWGSMLQGGYMDAGTMVYYGQYGVVCYRVATLVLWYIMGSMGQYAIGWLHGRWYYGILWVVWGSMLQGGYMDAGTMVYYGQYGIVCYRVATLVLWYIMGSMGQYAIGWLRWYYGILWVVWGSMLQGGYMDAGTMVYYGQYGVVCYRVATWTLVLWYIMGSMGQYAIGWLHGRWYYGILWVVWDSMLQGGYMDAGTMVYYGQYGVVCYRVATWTLVLWYIMGSMGQYAIGWLHGRWYYGILWVVWGSMLQGGYAGTMVYYGQYGIVCYRVATLVLWYIMGSMGQYAIGWLHGRWYYGILWVVWDSMLQGGYMDAGTMVYYGQYGVVCYRVATLVLWYIMGSMGQYAIGWLHGRWYYGILWVVWDSMLQGGYAGTMVYYGQYGVVCYRVATLVLWYIMGSMGQYAIGWLHGRWYYGILWVVWGSMLQGGYAGTMVYYGQYGIVCYRVATLVLWYIMGSMGQYAIGWLHVRWYYGILWVVWGSMLQGGYMDAGNMVYYGQYGVVCYRVATLVLWYIMGSMGQYAIGWLHGRWYYGILWVVWGSMLQGGYAGTMVYYGQYGIVCYRVATWTLVLWYIMGSMGQYAIGWLHGRWYYGILWVVWDSMLQGGYMDAGTMVYYGQYGIVCYRVATWTLVLWYIMGSMGQYAIGWLHGRWYYGILWVVWGSMLQGGYMDAGTMVYYGQYGVVCYRVATWTLVIWYIMGSMGQYAIGWLRWYYGILWVVWDSMLQGGYMDAGTMVYYGQYGIVCYRVATWTLVLWYIMGSMGQYAIGWLHGRWYYGILWVVWGSMLQGGYMDAGTMVYYGQYGIVCYRVATLVLWYIMGSMWQYAIGWLHGRWYYGILWVVWDSMLQGGYMDAGTMVYYGQYGIVCYRVATWTLVLWYIMGSMGQYAIGWLHGRWYYGILWVVWDSMLQGGYMDAGTMVYYGQYGIVCYRVATWTLVLWYIMGSMGQYAIGWLHGRWYYGILWVVWGSMLQGGYMDAGNMVYYGQYGIVCYRVATLVLWYIMGSMGQYAIGWLHGRWYYGILWVVWGSMLQGGYAGTMVYYGQYGIVCYRVATLVLWYIMGSMGQYAIGWLHGRWYYGILWVVWGSMLQGGYMDAGNMVYYGQYGIVCYRVATLVLWYIMGSMGQYAIGWLHGRWYYGILWVVWGSMLQGGYAGTMVYYGQYGIVCYRVATWTLVLWYIMGSMGQYAIGWLHGRWYYGILWVVWDSMLQGGYAGTMVYYGQYGVVCYRVATWTLVLWYIMGSMGQYAIGWLHGRWYYGILWVVWGSMLQGGYMDAGTMVYYGQYGVVCYRVATWTLVLWYIMGSMGQYAIWWLHGRWFYGILWVVWGSMLQGGYMDAGTMVYYGQYGIVCYRVATLVLWYIMGSMGQYAIGWLHGRWYYGILWVVWDSMLQGGYAGTMVYYGQYGVVCYRVATWTLVLWYIMGSMGQYAIGWLHGRWYYGILWVVWGSMLQGGYMDAGTMVYYGQYGIVCYRVATWTLVLWYIMGSMGQYAIGWLHGRWYYGILWVVWDSMLQGGYMDAGTMVYYGQYGVVCYRVATWTLVLWYIMGSMGQYAIGWLHGRWYYGILWVVWDSMLQGGYAGTMVYYGQYGVVCYRVATLVLWYIMGSMGQYAIGWLHGRWYYGILWVVWDSMLQGGYMDAGTMVYYGQYGVVCYRVATLVLWYIMGSMGQYAIGWLHGRWYYGILWVVWGSMLQGGYMDAGTMVYYGQYGIVCYRVATWTLVLWYIMGSMGQYAIGWLHGRWYYGILWVVWGSMLQGGYAGTMVYYGQYGIVCYRVATCTLVLWYIMGSMGQYAIGWLHGRWYYGILWVVWGSMLQGGYMDAGTMVYYGQYGIVCYRVATWTLVLWYIMGSMGQYAIGWLRWYYGILWVVWGSMLQGGYMDASTMVYYGQYGVVCYRVATLVLWYIMGSMGQYAIGWLHGRWYYGILWVVWDSMLQGGYAGTMVYYGQYGIVCYRVATWTLVLWYIMGSMGQYAIGWLRWYYGILWVVWGSMLQGGYMDAGTMVYYGQYGIVCYRVATWTLVLWYIMGSMGQYAIGWLHVRWYYGILWVVWDSMLQGGYMDAGTMVYYGQYGIVCYRVATWTLVLWYIMGSMGQYAIGWLHGRWYYGILWVVWDSMLQGGYMDAGTMVYYGQYGIVCYRVATWTLVLWYIMGSMGQYAIRWLHGRWYYGILWVVWGSMLQGGYAGTMVYYGQYGVVCYRVATWTLVLWYIMGSMGQYAIGWLRWYYGILWVVWGSMLQGGYAGTMVYYGQYGIVCYRVATMVLWYIMGSMGQYAIGWLHGRWYYGILWVVWDSMLQGGYMDAGTMVYYGQYGVVCYRVATWTLVLWYIMGSMGQYAIGWLRWYYGILWVVWGSMLQGGYAGTMVYYGQYGIVCYRVATWTLVLWYIMGSMGQYAIGWLHGRWYYGILWVVWGSMLQGGYAGTMVYYGQYGIVCYRVATWTLVLWYIMGSMGQYAIGWLRWYYGILWVVWDSMLQGGYMDAGTMVYHGQYGIVCYRVATLVLWYIMGSMGQYAIGWLHGRWYYGILWVVWGSMLQGGYMDAGTMVYYGQYGVVCYRVATWTLVLWYIMGSMGQYAIGWLHGRWYYGILWVVWGSMLQGGYMDAGTMVYYGQYGVVCYRVATWTLVLWYIMGSMGQYAIGWLRWYYGILWVVWDSMLQGGYMDAGTMVYYGQYGVVCYRVATWTLVLWYIMGSMGQYAIGWLHGRWYYGILWVVWGSMLQGGYAGTMVYHIWYIH